MCACEPDFTCSRCTDTPADPRYIENEREELEEVIPVDLERLPRA
jgi:hypothetical protein